MSLMGLFFNLYCEEDKSVNTEELIIMCKELWWLLVQFKKDETVAWNTINHFIVQCLVQSEIARGNTEPPTEQMNTLMDKLTSELTNNNNNNLKYKMTQLDQILKENEKSASICCELTLPSYRMAVLTNETLEMFFDHEFQDSFKLVKSIVEREKSLGRELFENLLSEGKNLAKESLHHIHHLQPSASTSSVVSSSNSINNNKTKDNNSNNNNSSNDNNANQQQQQGDINEGMDNLFTELGHLDIDDKDSEPYVLV